MRFLNLFEVDYIDMKGNQKSWVFASRQAQPKCTTGDFSKADAVVIVPYHVDKKKIVIIEEFRVPLAGYQFGFPAGLIDPGESIESSAARELKEETGLSLIRTLKQSPPVYSTSGMTDESVSMVYVECNGEADTSQNESSEDITVHFLTPAEAGHLIEAGTGRKFDVKTWLVLASFAQNGRL